MENSRKRFQEDGDSSVAAGGSRARSHVSVNGAHRVPMDDSTEEEMNPYMQHLKLIEAQKANGTSLQQQQRRRRRQEERRRQQEEQTYELQQLRETDNLHHHHQQQQPQVARMPQHIPNRTTEGHRKRGRSHIEQRSQRRRPSDHRCFLHEHYGDGELPSVLDESSQGFSGDSNSHEMTNGLLTAAAREEDFDTRPLAGTATAAHKQAMRPNGGDDDGSPSKDSLQNAMSLIMEQEDHDDLDKSVNSADQLLAMAQDDIEPLGEMPRNEATRHTLAAREEPLHPAEMPRNEAPEQQPIMARGNPLPLGEMQRTQARQQPRIAGGEPLPLVELPRRYEARQQRMAGEESLNRRKMQRNEVAWRSIMASEESLPGEFLPRNDTARQPRMARGEPLYLGGVPRNGTARQPRMAREEPRHLQKMKRNGAERQPRMAREKAPHSRVNQRNVAARQPCRPAPPLAAVEVGNFNDWTSTGRASTLSDVNTSYSTAMQESSLTNYSIQRAMARGKLEAWNSSQGQETRLLYTTDDVSAITPLEIFARQQLEFFAAKHSDVEQWTNEPIAFQQVGIRCVHCRSGARFPSSLNGIYRVVKKLVSEHLVTDCQSIPPSIRRELLQLLATQTPSRNRKYWVEKAICKGVVQDGNRLRYETDH